MSIAMKLTAGFLVAILISNLLAKIIIWASKRQ